MTHRIWGFTLILSLSTASAAFAAGDQWEKTYALTGRPDLHVLTDDGSVVVETWDRKSVGVRVISNRWQINSHQVRVEEDQSGNRIDLRVLRPHHHFNISFGFSNTSLRVELRIPREADVDIKTGDGSVTVSPISGRVSLHTGDGSIRADGLHGDIRLSSGDGSITASEVDGKLEAHTGDGRVRIDGRFDQLDLSSGDGSITASARSGSRLGEGWYVETGDGPVNLRIPSNLDAELDAHTGDGHIHLDLPVRVSGSLGHHTVRGDLNKGGPPLKIRTGDGSIRIAAS